MSAFEMVKKAQEAVVVATNALNEQKQAYAQSVSSAASALKTSRFSDAEKILTAMGFSKEGEDPQAYRALWTNAVTPPALGQISNASAEGWRLVRDFAPLEETMNIPQFFGRALTIGSVEVIKDLLPFYEKAQEEWHYNWDVSQMFGNANCFKGKEDKLLDRLQCIDLLVSEGTPSNRLTSGLEKISAIAHKADELNLAPTTLDAMSKTYVAMMNRCVEEKLFGIFDPSNGHLAPPGNLTSAHEKFKEHQAEHCAIPVAKKRMHP